MDPQLSPGARELLLALLDGAVLIREAGSLPHYRLDGKSADMDAVNELADPDLDYIDDGQPHGETVRELRVHLTKRGEEVARALRSGSPLHHQH